MTIKGIFRVQTRSDLPDTPRGVPHGKGIRPSRARHFGSPGKATGRCFRCLLLVICTYPFAKEALTLHLARSEGHERYFGCN